MAVLNKSAVALAADSAVTSRGTRGDKIYTANKVFALSRREPLGVMVYNAADVLGVPWETVIKEFRREFGSKRLNRVKEYESAFLDFVVQSLGSLLPFEGVDLEAYQTLGALLTRIDGRFQELARQAARSATSKAQLAGSIPDLALHVIRAARNDIEAVPYFTGFDADDAPKAFAEYADAFRENVLDLPFGQILTAPARAELETLAGLFLVKPSQIAPSSGVVIAGFGADDTFPALVHSIVFGIDKSKRLKRIEQAPASVTIKDEACVMAFAQLEMVATFMEGINEDMDAGVRDHLREAFEEALPAAVLSRLAPLLPPGALDANSAAISDALRQAGSEALNKANQWMDGARAQSRNTIMEAAGLLPKEDLALLAESLVNLTSLKRRVSLDSETVGGPIDVCVISKGDGFVWMKRKHYFESALNPQYFHRLNQECEPG